MSILNEIVRLPKRHSLIIVPPKTITDLAFNNLGHISITKSLKLSIHYITGSSISVQVAKKDLRKMNDDYTIFDLVKIFYSKFENKRQL